MVDLTISGCRVEQRPEVVNVVIDAGNIVDISETAEFPSRERITLEGNVLLPGFVNPHVHLDKAFIGGLTQSGLMLDGVARGAELKRRYTREDIKGRAARALDLAVRHGITQLRSPADVDPIVGTLCVQALCELRDEYRDRIDLQVLAFPQEGFLGVDGMHDLMKRAVAEGADVVGGRPHGDPPDALDYERHINDVLDIADGRPVDMSTDAVFPPDPIHPFDLGVAKLADAAIRRGYPLGLVTAHHVLALSALDDRAAQPVIARIREAGMNVIALPTSNLFTEGRTDVRNPRRGLTRLKELWAAGVNVAFGTDNLDDTYLPFSNIDPLLEAHVCACAAHFGTINERRALVQMMTHNASQILGIEKYGIAPGAPADVVVLDTTSYDAIVTTQPEKRYVLKKGKIVIKNTIVTERVAPQMSYRT